MYQFLQLEFEGQNCMLLIPENATLHQASQAVGHFQNHIQNLINKAEEEKNKNEEKAEEKTAIEENKEE